MTRMTLEVDILNPEAVAKAALVFNVLNGEAVAGNPVVRAAAPADKPARARKPAAVPTETAAAPPADEPPAEAPAADTPAPAPAPEATPEAPAVSRQQLAELIQASVKNAAIGRAKVVATLESFRSKCKPEFQSKDTVPEIKLPMIPDTQYAALYAAVQKLAPAA